MLSIFTATRPDPSSLRFPEVEKWRWVATGTATLVFLFCLLVALTQFVNPFPHDGWFYSQYRLFGRSPGADNYTPVAVPAFLYAFVHFATALFGRGLVAEFYLGSLLHHLLLFSSAVFLYLSHGLLGLRKSGLLASVLLILFVESTLMPQAFWSENVTLFLMSGTLLVAFAILTSPQMSDRKFLALAFVFGSLIGGLTITRLIPFVILPGLVLFYRFHLPPHRVIRFASVATGVVLVMVLACMGANAYRYGRFELTNSAGRHLWNLISVRSDEMLAESREYQILRRAIPDVQGKYWWEIQPQDIDGLKNFTREELFRTLSRQAIFRRPLTFAAIGMRNSLLLLRQCPRRIGLARALYYNPLKRSTMLPALVHPLPPLEKFLALFHQAAVAIYAYAVYATLALGFFTAVTREILSAHAVKGHGAPTSGVWLFLVAAFFAMLYLTGQIERPDSRYSILYLPLVFLIASTTLRRLTEVWTKTSWKESRVQRLWKKETEKVA